MFRYMVAWLPTFRLERCGWRTSQNVVLVEEVRNTLRIQCATPAAINNGVRVGMGLSEARARCPDLLVEYRSVDEESADLHELADQLLSISPAVAPLPPTALVAELHTLKTDQTAGRERMLIERVRNQLSALGHPARIVIADTPETASLLAEAGHSNHIVPLGGTADALAPLSIFWLNLPSTDQTLLRGLGVDTLGALAALDAASLVGRVSHATVAAHTLAQGRRQCLPLPHTTLESSLSVSHDLPAPVEHLEALLFIVNALLRDACIRLCARSLATVCVELQLSMEDGRVQTIAARLGTPCRDPAALLTLLRARTENLTITAPVDAVTLVFLENTRFDGRQHDLFQRHRATEALVEVTARLRDALGASAVFRPRLVDTHRPERAWLKADPPPEPLSSPTSYPWDQAAPAAQAESAHPHIDDPVFEWRGRPPQAPPTRPSVLIHPPISIQVRTDAHGRPQCFEFDGRWLDVQHTQGPERISTEWWEHPFDRDYWKLTCSGGQNAWIYREQRHWLLHGWWD